MKKYKYKIRCKNCNRIDGMSRNNMDLSHLECSYCGKVGTSKYIRFKIHHRKKK